MLLLLLAALIVRLGRRGHKRSTGDGPEGSWWHNLAVVVVWRGRVEGCQTGRGGPPALPARVVNGTADTDAQRHRWAGGAEESEGGEGGGDNDEGRFYRGEEKEADVGFCMGWSAGGAT